MLVSDTLLERETITKEEIDELVSTGKLSDKESNDDLKSLKETAKELGIKGYTKMSKEELESAIENSTEK